MSHAQPDASTSAVILRAIEVAIATDHGADADVMVNPTVLGRGLFQLSILSTTIGCHFFTSHLDGEQRIAHAAIAMSRLRAAARDAGWDAVHGWLVCAPDMQRDLPRGMRLWPMNAVDTASIRAVLAQSLHGKRPSIATRRMTIRLLQQAFHHPLGAFDGKIEPARARGNGVLRKELTELEQWLTARSLAEEQRDLVTMELDGQLALIYGPAGSGKTTVLARQAARLIESMRRVGNRRTVTPSLLVTARTASAAMHLRARVLGAYQRWTMLRRLPAWVDSMALPDAVRRLRARRDAGTAHGWNWILVDEAQELDADWWRWLLTHGLAPTGPRGILAVADESQRICAEPPPLGQPADDHGLQFRVRDLPLTYRTPKQIIEPAFNLLYGTFARDFSMPAARAKSRSELLQACRVSRADDEWMRVHFSARGIGISGAPTGTTPRMVRARSTRAAAIAAVQDALTLVDDQGALPADVVVIAVDGHAALAIMRAAAAHGSESRFERTRTDPHGALTKRIRVLTVVECRGHDFPIALVVGVERLDGSHTTRTLLYQAMTRAQHMLVAYGVTGNGLSDELGECCVRMGLEGGQ